MHLREGDNDDATTTMEHPQICWLFTKEKLANTPSIQEGFDVANERRHRREGAKLIMDAGVRLGL